jgi:GNAT superfamily N-acetyltransferase
VRKAGEGDVDLLFDIRTSVRENYQSREELAGLGITPESVAHMLRSDSCAWICEIDDRPAGFSMANARDRTVYALFVRPDYEGRGAGRSLLKAAEAWLFDQGLAEIWLSTGSDRTLRAQGFYRRMGWWVSGSPVDGSVIFIRRRPQPDPKQPG